MIMKKCLAVLLTALLPLLPASASDKPMPEPVSRKVVMLTILEYATPEDIHKVCDNPKANACTWHWKAGRAVIAVVAPRSWCDWTQLKTWGHELVQVWGKAHTKAFKQYIDAQPRWPMRGENCHMVPYR